MSSIESDPPLDPEQQYALEYVVHNLNDTTGGKKYFYVAGYAGTGKSHLLKQIMATLAPERESLALAWTGIASQILGGMTLVAFCGLEFDHTGHVADTGFMRCRSELTGRMIRGMTDRGLRQKIRDGKLLLVFDEIVAIHDSVLDALLAAFQDLRRGLIGCHEPFGGIPAVLSGDPCQLGRMELYGDSPKFPSSDYPTGYCWEGITWSHMAPDILYLQKFHRGGGSDTAYLNLLAEIRMKPREGGVPQFSPEALATLEKTRDRDGGKKKPM
ncbi:hypothetical protein FOL47_008060 [Perkinsus chesapeaki]|uniref:ATP-dependent DNA helicase n=1 Tax=Perkinsus chesapeaki TaxID=330153 RepID=A0A7J6N2J0_PERCH|nr:hypothetical protein FOL47_008060 [Perkinsus chesapeaki]